MKEDAAKGNSGNEGETTISFGKSYFDTIQSANDEERETETESERREMHGMYFVNWICICISIWIYDGF